MEHSHKCITKEAKLCIFYDEKIILCTKHGYIKNSLLCTLFVIDKLWYNILGLINNHVQCNFNTKKKKRIIRIRLGLGRRSSCRGVFKKLDTLTVPSLYIFAVIILVLRNPNHFKIIPSIHSTDTRQKIS